MAYMAQPIDITLGTATAATRAINNPRLAKYSIAAYILTGPVRNLRMLLPIPIRPRYRDLTHETQTNA